MIDKAFDQIGKEDIELLVSDAEPESRTLEYKEALPGNTDSNKKEFLADVSALANTAGGDLVYGIVEKRDATGKPTGIPDRAEGVAVPNQDAEIMRLENIIRTGVQPRIPGIQLRAVDGFPCGPVVVIRVQKSWLSPHMVTHAANSRFFARTSKGKYPLDVGEIRSAFLQSESLGQKIAAFRQERISEVFVDETPIKMGPGPKLVIHMVPIALFGTSGRADLGLLHEKSQQMAPICPAGFGTRFNSHGFLVYSKDADRPCRGYVQVLRNGVIEVVDTATIVLERPGHPYDGKKVIISILLETEVFRALNRMLKVLAERAGFPIFVAAALRACKRLT